MSEKQLFKKAERIMRKTRRYSQDTFEWVCDRIEGGMPEWLICLMLDGTRSVSSDIS